MLTTRSFIQKLVMNSKIYPDPFARLKVSGCLLAVLIQSFFKKFSFLRLPELSTFCLKDDNLDFAMRLINSGIFESPIRADGILFVRFICDLIGVHKIISSEGKLRSLTGAQKKCYFANFLFVEL